MTNSYDMMVGGVRCTPMVSLLREFLPPLKWMGTYSSRMLKRDLLSSLSTLLVSVPLAVAVSILIGLSPSILILNLGIHSLLLWLLSPSGRLGASPSLPLLLVYSTSLSSAPSTSLSSAPSATLGSSPSATLGSAYSSFSSLSSYNEGLDPVSPAATLSLLISSAILGLISLLKIGDLSSYLSQAVLTGLGCSSMFIVSSLSCLHLLGLHPHQPPSNILQPVSVLVSRLGDINPTDSALGFSVLGVLIAIKALPGVYIGEGPDLTTPKSRLVRNIKLILSVSRFSLLLLLSVLLCSFTQTFSRLKTYTNSTPFKGDWSSIDGVDTLLTAVILSFLTLALERESHPVTETVDSSMSSRLLCLSHLVSALVGAPPVSVMKAPVLPATPAANLSTGLVLILLSRVPSSLETSIPVPCLSAILIAYSIFLPNIELIVRFWNFDRLRLGVSAATLMCSVLVDSTSGLLVGLAVDTLLLLQRSTRLNIEQYNLCLAQQTIRVLTPMGDLYSLHIPQLNRSLQLSDTMLQPDTGQDSYSSHPAREVGYKDSVVNDQDNVEIAGEDVEIAREDTSEELTIEDPIRPDLESLERMRAGEDETLVHPPVYSTCINLEHTVHMDTQVARTIRIWEYHYRCKGQRFLMAGANHNMRSLLIDILPSQICVFINSISDISNPLNINNIGDITSVDVVSNIIDKECISNVNHIHNLSNIIDDKTNCVTDNITSKVTVKDISDINQINYSNSTSDIDQTIDLNSTSDINQINDLKHHINDLNNTSDNNDNIRLVNSSNIRDESFHNIQSQ